MTRPAGEHAHLSIGEVLSLLQEEFPDVTISKIRFLESQGLLDPERTPSGYRKFYEADIERLRWILTQQRENFLPLKVIKDRLDEVATGAPTDDAGDRPRAVLGGDAAAAGRADPSVAGRRPGRPAGADLDGRRRPGRRGPSAPEPRSAAAPSARPQPARAPPRRPTRAPAAGARARSTWRRRR